MTALKPSLDEALDIFQVEDRGAHDPGTVEWWPKTFPWGVSTPNSGIVALFTTEEAANAYRQLLVMISVSSGLVEGV